MSIDRLLTKVLELLLDVHDDARTEQIYGSTTTLLTNLSNPLNISLLTSQLLIAPAIWGRPDGMRTCYRVISIYNSAAIHVRRNEIENAKNKGQQRLGGGLGSDAWTKAVLKGADDQSSRWQHLLVFGGVLMGMESSNRNSLSGGMRRTVERAVVTSANLALQRDGLAPLAPAGPVALALNYTFSLLSESSRAMLDCDALIPTATTALLGPDGLGDGWFLSAIELDVHQAEDKFTWEPNSPSYLHITQLEKKPLVSGLGPLSRLLGYAIQNARDSRVILQLQDDLVAFTGKLFHHWQANKLSELEISEESLFLTPQTITGTWEGLWQFLKKLMYGIVAISQAVVARSLLDWRLKKHDVAPVVATKTLHTLRNLYFISSRNGSDSFQVYSFTYLTSLDTLARFGEASAAFLQAIKPTTEGSIPAHPLHRTLDLFYLNVAEHLPLHLPPEACDKLIVQPAITYLTHSAPLSPRMMELFESAHSAVLSVLSCPHNAPITVELVPFYAETLFSSFPKHISPRQFRLAFKTMMQILSPPFPIAASHPRLAEALLEMVRYRASVAGQNPDGEKPLPPPPAVDPQAQQEAQDPVSEQSTLVLTLIDALPFLQLNIFEDWMTLAAHSVNEIKDNQLREVVKRRFWEVLVSGEMDVERAAIGVAWWGTKGGREAVLFGQPPQKQEEMYMMSGALSSPARQCKL
ncbi:putative PEX8 peroxisomal biogenesis factor 8 [Triangularia verruculosa]|uniref:PEX8 peroxisomal biogenesis factor 8 n=1 Tax=Triangularia verruculosa TaxID=2587418 RepID=A0AAN6XKY3_9PEZI|nr:putative PEX8 peroxisomal biogenesis factor 8 [Triangularia verruculosa]